MKYLFGVSVLVVSFIAGAAVGTHLGYPFIAVAIAFAILNQYLFVKELERDTIGVSIEKIPNGYRAYFKNRPEYKARGDTIEEAVSLLVYAAVKLDIVATKEN